MYVKIKREIFMLRQWKRRYRWTFSCSVERKVVSEREQMVEDKSFDVADNRRGILLLPSSFLFLFRDSGLSTVIALYYLFTENRFSETGFEIYKIEGTSQKVIDLH